MARRKASRRGQNMALDSENEGWEEEGLAFMLAVTERMPPAIARMFIARAQDLVLVLPGDRRASLFRRLRCEVLRLSDDALLVRGR